MDSIESEYTTDNITDDGTDSVFSISKEIIESGLFTIEPYNYNWVKLVGSKDIWLLLSTNNNMPMPWAIRSNFVFKPITFEDVLDSVSNDVKEELLFHLDIFA
jgi:hypothetical protein